VGTNGGLERTYVLPRWCPIDVRPDLAQLPSSFIATSRKAIWIVEKNTTAPLYSPSARARLSQSSPELLAMTQRK